jgi:hypothetical protein
MVQQNHFSFRAMDNPQPAARISAGKRSCGEWLLRKQPPTPRYGGLSGHGGRTDVVSFILDYWRFPDLHLFGNELRRQITGRSAQHYGAKRNVLDWVVIFQEVLKMDGQGMPWNYPAYDAGAALPLS